MAHSNILKLTVLGSACLALGGLLGTAALALADNDRATQTVLGSNLIMPYDGYLMVNSSAVTGSRTIRFKLYESPGGAAAPVWEETQLVTLLNGRFSVGLGSITSLNNTILDAEQVYLGMEVLEDDGAGNITVIELAGRQAIVPAPYAAWSSAAADLDVGGDLSVDGSATIAGAASVGSLTVGGLTKLQNTQVTGNVTIQQKLTVGQQLTVTGNLLAQGNLTASAGASISGNLRLNDQILDITDKDGISYHLTGNDLSYPSTGLSVRATQNPADGEPLLRVLSQGGAERLRVEHNGTTKTDNHLNVTGDATIGGDATINGDLTVTGDITNFVLAEGSFSQDGTGNGENRTGGNLVSTGLQSGGTGTPNSICFLTNVRFENAGNGERNACSILYSASKQVWQLYAITQGDNDTNTECSARCLSW